jgi:hypothetical protein
MIIEKEIISYAKSCKITDLHDLIEKLRDIYSHRFLEEYYMVDVFSSKSDISEKIKSETGYDVRYIPYTNGYSYGGGTNRIYIPREDKTFEELSKIGSELETLYSI